MKVICYACGKGEFPENTIEGITQCQKINPGWRVEMDIQLTKDGKAVLFHDEDLYRITNVDKLIAESTYSEIEAFDAAHNFKKELGFPLRGKTYKIPLLADVFKRFPKTKYLLDIHANNTKIVDKVILLAEEHLVEKQIVLVSKHHHILKQFRSKKPNWTYGASSKEVKLLLFTHFIGLSSLIKPKADVVMMPVVYQNHKILSKRLVRAITRKHKEVWVWLHEGKEVLTIDTKNHFERMNKYDVDACFTSCPNQLNNEIFSLKRV